MLIHSPDAVLLEIDATIDKLLENAKALKKIAHQDAYHEEISALEKTQESLIAHLIHMDEMLKKKDRVSAQKPLLASKVHNKLGRAGYLNKILGHTDINPLQTPKKPKIHKRKVLAQQKN